MHARWPLLCLLATSCDAVFGLGQLPATGPDGAIDGAPIDGGTFDAPAPVVFIVDGDADHDGTPNASDGCPLDATFPGPGGADTDGDGVGDICDPHPGTPDCLTLFDQFIDDASIDPRWLQVGVNLTKDPSSNALVVAASAGRGVLYAMPALDLSTLRLDAYVAAGTDSGPHQVALFPDLSAAASLDGHGVTLADVTTGPSAVIDLAAVTAVAGAEQRSGDAPTLPRALGAGITFDLRWNGGKAEANLAENRVGGMVGGAVIVPPAFAPGHVGLEVVALDVQLATIVGYSQRCP